MIFLCSLLCCKKLWCKHLENIFDSTVIFSLIFCAKNFHALVFTTFHQSWAHIMSCFFDNNSNLLGMFDNEDVIQIINVFDYLSKFKVGTTNPRLLSWKISRQGGEYKKTSFVYPVVRIRRRKRTRLVVLVYLSISPQN